MYVCMSVCVCASLFDNLDIINKTFQIAMFHDQQQGVMEIDLIPPWSGSWGRNNNKASTITVRYTKTMILGLW